MEGAKGAESKDSAEGAETERRRRARRTCDVVVDDVVVDDDGGGGGRGGGGRGGGGRMEQEKHKPYMAMWGKKVKQERSVKPNKPQKAKNTGGAGHCWTC